MSDINIGALSEAINDKMDRDLNNRSTDSGLRKLVESYVNGTSWYKIFDEIQSDGTVKKWCEQGNTYEEIPAAGKTITLLKPYVSDKFTVFACRCTSNYTSAQGNGICGRPSASQVFIGVGGGATDWAQWEAEGYIS